MQRNIKVLVVEPYKEPYEKVIKNNLKEKQDLVGGLIEYTRIENEDNALLICNEEGKLLDLEPNRVLGRDIIVGTFFIVGDDPDIGEDRSLTNNQIERLKIRFGRESILETEARLCKIMLERNIEL